MLKSEKKIPQPEAQEIKENKSIDQLKEEEAAKNRRLSRRNGPPGMTGEKPKNFRKAISDIFRYIGKYKIAILIALIFAAAATVFEVFGPKVMGKATTELAEGLMRKIEGTGGIDFDAIRRILIITISLYGISAASRFVEGWVMTGVTQKILYRLRREISEKIDRMPMKYFEETQYGEVLSRITNDVDTLGIGLNQSITTIITSVATIVGVIVMMISISGLMTLIALVSIPLSAVMVGLVIKFSQKHFQDQQKYLGLINGQVEEDFSGQIVIKAFNKEEDKLKEFEETNGKLFDSAWRSQFISGMMMPIISFFGNLGYAGVAVSGGFLAIKGSIGIGDIQAFIQYVRNLTSPLEEVSRVLNQVQSMAAAAERVFDFLAEEEEIQTAENAVHPVEIKGAVSFECVRFGYDKNKVIIKNFSADVKPGQKIAIVGPTGAGKTTIVKLLMRFYDVDSGSIKLDGYDIKDFNRRELRENFAMVLQDTWLFSGTIMENIRYGKPGAADEEVIKAAKAARAHKFIKTLPGGYDMVLNEDATNVSEGQRQLLTIARAILADKNVLILDEATSSVDTRTEARIQKAMDFLMEGRTSFIIAHRLSTIKNADLILVLDHGDIVEQGTHEELLVKGGFYSELYNSQFEPAI